MAAFLGRALLAGAFLLVLHAGYSALHFEALFTERYGSAPASLPWDIYVESAAAVVLVLIGATWAVGGFVPIYTSSEGPDAFHKLFSPRLDFAPLRPSSAAASATAIPDGSE